MTSKIIFFTIALIFTFSVTTVHAQTNSITVQTDQNNYEEGDTIVISGHVETIVIGTPMVLHIFFEGNMIDISQITVAKDGSYSHTVIAEGPLWNKEGDYLIRASYGEGNIAETQFNFAPKTDMSEITNIFEVDAGSSGTFDVEYTIKRGTVKNMVIDPESFSIIVQIESTDEGTITLDLPREFIGAEKQDGNDDFFIVLIDGIEVPYQELVTTSDFRKISINFEQGDSDIEIIGTDIITAKKPTGGTTPVFRIIPDKPHVGSTIRVTGYGFEHQKTYDFYIDTTKIGSFVTESNGNFFITLQIPENIVADRTEFIIKNDQGEKTTVSIRLGSMEKRISEIKDIPLTGEIVPVTPVISVSTDSSSYKQGDIVSISGKVENYDDNVVTLYIIDPDTVKIWEEKLLIRDDGSFSTLVIAGNDWLVDGKYVLTATYGSAMANVYLSFKTEHKIEPEIKRPKVPEWIKNNAEWWSQGKIDDDTFVSGVQYMIKEKILNIPTLPEPKLRPSFVDESKDPQHYIDRYQNEPKYKEWFDENYPDYTIEEAVGIPEPIPEWIKNNAEWWSQGLITEDDFVKGIEYLVEKRIITVQ